MPRRRGVIFVWCAVGLIILSSSVYFGPQMLTYCRLRSLVLRPSDIPPRGWDSAPERLADTKASTADGSTLEYYGYRFEVPWKGIDRDSNEGRAFEVRFKTGQVIRFLNPEFFQDDPINNHVAKDDRDYFVRAFEAGVHESKYEQVKAIVSATPSQWSPFRSHEKFARVWILLNIKGLWFEHNTAPPDIFSIETSSYRGFEFSGLSRDWQNVTLNLFDGADRRFQINVLGDARSGVRITQPEINRMIQSFGPHSP
jgi:hypothetical protein